MLLRLAAAGSLAGGLLIGAPSHIEAVTWDLLPPCTSTIAHGPLPVGCATGIVPITADGSGRIGSPTVNVLTVTSSNPAVAVARIISRPDRNRWGPNSIEVASKAVGSTEICYEFPRRPLRIVDESGSSSKSSNVSFASAVTLSELEQDKEAAKTERERHCVTVEVGANLSVDCMATDTNSEGLTISNNHIHVGCRLASGRGLLRDGRAPIFTEVWSSDPSLLKAWGDSEGRVQTEALAPGRAVACYTLAHGPEWPPYITGTPACFSFVIHPLTVNVRGLRRATAEPSCNYDDAANTAFVQVGCYLRLSTTSATTASSSEQRVVGLFPDLIHGRLGLVAAREGVSRVCVDRPNGRHCVDVQVVNPNENPMLKSLTVSENSAQGSDQTLDSTSADQGVSSETVTESVSPSTSPRIISRSKGFQLSVKRNGENIILSVRTDSPARANLRVLVQTLSEGGQVVRTRAINHRLKPKQARVIRITAPEGSRVIINTVRGKRLAVVRS